MKKVKVIQDSDTPVAAEVLAKAIQQIGDAVRRLDACQLNERAIVLLLSNASGVGKTETQNVLWGLRNLETLFLKKKQK
jgi:hypothetical protein